MPDLQSELSKLAHAWDNHEKQIRSTPEKTVNPTFSITKTNNLSRDLFNYIKQGTFTREEVRKAMEGVGYNGHSASSLITQMVRVGMLIAEGDTVRTNMAEYKPISNPTKNNPSRTYNRKSTTNKPHTKPSAKTHKAAGLAALEATSVTSSAPREPNPARLVRLQTAADVLANMSVVEAHKLYVELGKMFGGK